MALTVDGKVFSWGEGDDGKLGHYSRTYVPDLLILLMLHISSSSACIDSLCFVA